MHPNQINDLKDRFSFLAINVFGLSINEYLTSSQNRQLLIYSIDLQTRSFIPLFGNPPKELTDAMNLRFYDAKAGYRVAVQNVFHVANLNADVLLLSNEVISASKSELDTILIHEICHLIIDSDSLSLTKFSLNEKSRYSGERLYKKTDQHNEQITKHTIKFCTLLAAAAEIYASLSDELNTREAVLNSAMRYDLRLNIRA